MIFKAFVRNCRKKNDRLKAKHEQAELKIVKLLAEIEKLKCCGSCDWCGVISKECTHEDSPYSGQEVYLSDICDKWEARE